MMAVLSFYDIIPLLKQNSENTQSQLKKSHAYKGTNYQVKLTAIFS
jgi:hypothetical protein